MAGLINTVSGSIPSTGLSSNLPTTTSSSYQNGHQNSAVIELNAAIMNNSGSNLNKLQHVQQQQQQHQQQNVEYPDERQNFIHHITPMGNAHHSLLFTASNHATNAVNSSNNGVNNVLTNTYPRNIPAANTYLWIVTPVAAR